MATLQKFKLLATQCAVAGSPTRSPTTSPVIHLRRRKTLRMLLNRTDRRRFQRGGGEDREDLNDSSPERTTSDFRVRRKLKDLFVSSPPMDEGGNGKRREVRERLLPEIGVRGIGGRRNVSGSSRPIMATFRYRLLRRAWRPVLVTIPE